MSLSPIIFTAEIVEKVDEQTAFGILNTLTIELNAINEELEVLNAKRKSYDVSLRIATEIVKKRGFRRTGITEPEIKPVEKQAQVSEIVAVELHDGSEPTLDNRSLILEILNGVKRGGLTGSQVGAILKEKYNRDIGRYVYVQLARLRDENKIVQEDKRWKLA